MRQVIIVRRYRFLVVLCGYQIRSTLHCHPFHCVCSSPSSSSSSLFRFSSLFYFFFLSLSLLSLSIFSSASGSRQPLTNRPLSSRHNGQCSYSCKFYIKNCRSDDLHKVKHIMAHHTDCSGSRVANRTLNHKSEIFHFFFHF